ncbi:glycosyltransferase [Rathayibacter sp. AY1A5]|uniref:glycosyltransferase n=1 Tax=Rathayibacter sp. AY1A5 TaxID=2080523 RepID=UPI0011B0E7EA|nr:nucleotide disphospho-sugar-binding domain-containing protein [Rathayibacter sp. AY1A5]
MKRAVVLHVSWGRGNGHVTRLVAIGRAFHSAGWDCVLLGRQNAVHDRLVSKAGIFTTAYYREGVADIDPWAEWGDPGVFDKAVVADVAVLQRFRPDRVINDNRLSMIVACASLSIPIVTLCQDNQLVGYRYQGEGVSEIWTGPLMAVNEALGRRGLPLVDRDVRELFERGLIAIPSAPSLDVMESRVGMREVVFTGVLGPVKAGLHGSGLLFYRTVGGIDSEFLHAFENWEGEIYVATGDQASADSYRHVPDAIHVAALWDLEEVFPELAAVVHHGGHGIATTCVASGVPAVILPGHNPERRSNGYRVELSGWGKVLGPLSAEGTRWGPAVDVTGDRPPWSDVRGAVDALRAPDVDAGGSVASASELVRLLT